MSAVQSANPSATELTKDEEQEVDLRKHPSGIIPTLQ